MFVYVSLCTLDLEAIDLFADLCLAKLLSLFDANYLGNFRFRFCVYLYHSLS